MHPLTVLITSTLCPCWPHPSWPGHLKIGGAAPAKEYHKEEV